MDGSSKNCCCLWRQSPQNAPRGNASRTNRSPAIHKPQPGSRRPAARRSGKYSPALRNKLPRDWRKETNKFIEPAILFPQKQYLCHMNSKLRHLLLIVFSIFPILTWGTESPSTADSIRISLLTCAPGEEIYSLFGHTAIRYEEPARGIDRVYNYGLFSFNTPNR